MDWANQPDPFRTYQTEPIVLLPFLNRDPSAAHADLYRRTHSSPRPFDLKTVSGFLELSLALSAWKAAGQAKWALRINPSSGNLHPTEAHLLLPTLPDLVGGVYHYNPLPHALEARVEVPEFLWAAIHDSFQTSGFFCALTSIFWREAWKYGERAFRYCNHDIGHALAALSFSANLFGWRAVVVDSLSDDDIEALIGLDRVDWAPLEAEHPEVLLLIHPIDHAPQTLEFPTELIESFRKLPVKGRPNRLSPHSVNWEIIYATAGHTRKRTALSTTVIHDNPPRIAAASAPGLTAAEIIRRRRSATAFDMDGDIDKATFLSMLDATLARDGQAPFDANLMPSSVHLAVFVHNVSGVEPGIYLLLRNPEDRGDLTGAFRPDFLWTPLSASLPLYLLQPGDFRMAAIDISCHQEIAGFSAFSLGMLARFAPIVTTEPYRYRHLFWETGMIGQVLYLEAEAHGVRGTGIGCFFDDEIHQLMGLGDDTWQSLYHFTVGRPIEDRRLTTLAPYHHLDTRNR